MTETSTIPAAPPSPAAADLVAASPLAPPPLWTAPVRALLPLVLGVAVAFGLNEVLAPALGGFASLLAFAGINIVLAVSLNVVNGYDPKMLISMRNIWKTYQMGTEQVHALHGVSFDIPRGEYIAIIGPSGSGKSTLMNLIGCLDTPTQGEYWLNGKNVSDMDDDELAAI